MSRLHAEGIHSLDAGERFPRPLGPDPVAALMASEAIGHVILEDFLHREQQRLVHVLAGERRQAVIDRNSPTQAITAS